MAAPIASIIVLPNDAGNAGKKARTQTRVVGSNTVHEHFFIPISERSVLGKYKASTGFLTVPAAITNGTTTGYAWLYNPIGSTRKMSVHKIMTSCQFIVLAVDLLAGELRFNRFTFTGTGSGTLVVAALRDSTDAAVVGNLRLASTSLSVSLGAVIMGYQYPTMDLVTGGAGHWNPSIVDMLESDKSDEIILRAGEGIVAFHNIAVTTANRRLHINYAWEEFE